MAQFKVASNSVVRCDASAGGTLVDISSFVDSISPGPGLSFASLDVTTFSDAAERVIAGIEQGQELTLEGPFDDTGTANPDAIFSTAAGTIISFEFNPVGTSGGDRQYSGEFLVMSYNVNLAVKERVSWSATIKLDGQMTAGTN